MTTLKTELKQIASDLNDIETFISAGNAFQEVSAKLKGKGKALRSLENDTTISDDTIEVLASRINDLIRNLAKASSSYNFTKKSLNQLKSKLEEAQVQAQRGAK